MEKNRPNLSSLEMEYGEAFSNYYYNLLIDTVRFNWKRKLIGRHLHDSTSSIRVKKMILSEWPN